MIYLGKVGGGSSSIVYPDAKLGSEFVIYLNGNLTIKPVNLVDGQQMIIHVQVDYGYPGLPFTITWDSSIQWHGSSAPAAPNPGVLTVGLVGLDTTFIGSSHTVVEMWRNAA